ncbi:prepilin-type N-terminal cleavage/methylation domain-containing protein [Rugamonas sp. FT107W]|uniref:Prepilin-type N-terminal cleavage/methylation domain-containing protein n=1 Tax=Duganella vulcania TaxID=2692166 RepID=A0A845HNY0_9BURK|nr:prepilin-type N-terminal cleavage/methylation domain-containing protein [Duganella vulcania]MYN20478.1 prepilin-type N-terminal cleavage/methylation domain-containing protein [Duganella vulcania]
MGLAQRRHSRPARPGGFTLVELVTVLVVVGVLGAFAAPRFFQRQGFDAVAYTDQMRALLRYGQKIAIAQGRNVFVRLNGSSAALCYDAACTAHLPPAGGSNSGTKATLARCGTTAWACEGVPSGLAASAATFFFDPTGQPFAANDPPGGLNSTFVPLTLAVTGDGSAHNITVTPVTGYVY